MRSTDSSTSRPCTEAMKQWVYRPLVVVAFVAASALAAGTASSNQSYAHGRAVASAMASGQSGGGNLVPTG